MTLYHLLKLFQSDTNAMLGKKTVVSEFYDEMVRPLDESRVCDARVCDARVCEALSSRAGREG